MKSEQNNDDNLRSGPDIVGSSSSLMPELRTILETTHSKSAPHGYEAFTKRMHRIKIYW